MEDPILEKKIQGFKTYNIHKQFSLAEFVGKNQIVAVQLQMFISE